MMGKNNKLYQKALYNYPSLIITLLKYVHNYYCSGGCSLHTNITIINNMLYL